MKKCLHARRSKEGARIGLRDGHAGWRGLATCKRIWECMGCQACKKRKESDILKLCMAEHRAAGRSSLMVSVTIRHAWDDDLKALRKGVARAWSAMLEGRAWKNFCKEWGLWGGCKAVEVTRGPSGWHPHIHAVLIFERWLTDDEMAIVEEELWKRWQTCVVRHLGKKHEPEWPVGLKLTRCTRSEQYISKLNLEVLDPAMAKRAKSGRRSWAQLMQDATSGEDAGAVHRLHEFAVAMKGAKMVDRFGAMRAQWKRVREQLDDDQGVDDVQFDFPPDVYDAIREHGNAKLDLLKEAKLHGIEGVRRYVARVLGDYAASRIQRLTEARGPPGMPLSSIS